MTFTLGRDEAGARVALSNEERSRHVHVIGASGSGKSKLLESLIRRDILAGRGLCLIDPHGSLADDVLAWCASRRLDDLRRIHVIEPSDCAWAAAFNPLRLDTFAAPSVRVDAMVAACAQVWGGEDTTRTPLLKKCLRAVFYALAVRELTLVEAVELVSATDAAVVRRRLTENLPDSVFDAVWRDFNALSRSDFAEQFSSTNNRLLEFLNSLVVRRMVGQRERSLDLRAIMDRGDFVIVNLALRGALSPDSARLIGTLLTSDLFLTALGRPANVSRPFTLYIDECYDYLTSDIERMLDQTRKFGLHLVLGHQRLGQLSERSQGIYNSVMAGAQTKVVFGGLGQEDAGVMAREIFDSSIDLERPKHILDRPTVVGEEVIWLEGIGGGTSSSYSSGIATADGWSSDETASTGLTEQFLGTDAMASSYTTHTSSGRSSGRSGSATNTESSGSAFSQSWSRTQALRPVRHVLPTAVYSLDEELHLAAAELRELPSRVAYVKRRGAPPTRFVTETIRPPLNGAGRIKSFCDGARERSAHIVPVETADAEIAARHARLRQQPEDNLGDDDPFWR